MQKKPSNAWERCNEFSSTDNSVVCLFSNSHWAFVEHQLCSRYYAEHWGSNMELCTIPFSLESLTVEQGIQRVGTALPCRRRALRNAYMQRALRPLAKVFPETCWPSECYRKETEGISSSTCKSTVSMCARLVMEGVLWWKYILQNSSPENLLSWFTCKQKESRLLFGHCLWPLSFNFHSSFEVQLYNFRLLTSFLYMNHFL